MNIPLKEAILKLKDELRQAILDSKGTTIVFSPKEVELELTIGFEEIGQVGGGFKVLALFDASAQASTKMVGQHRLTLKLDVTDTAGRRVFINDDRPRELR